MDFPLCFEVDDVVCDEERRAERLTDAITVNVVMWNTLSGGLLLHVSDGMKRRDFLREGSRILCLYTCLYEQSQLSTARGKRRDSS